MCPYLCVVVLTKVSLVGLERAAGYFPVPSTAKAMLPVKVSMAADY